MKKFKFLENIATADAAFEAYGKTREELFENAALALFETMVETKSVVSCQLLVVSCRNDTIEGLLFDFLNELVFLKDEKGMVFSKFEVRIEKLQTTSLRSELRPRVYKLQAWVWGEEIDKKKHIFKTDVKAITMHQFRVEKTKEGYKARVILDI